MSSSGRWTKDQLKLAFNLYCQLPFGKLHRGNPEIMELANNIERTPSAVAMKLVNFASLDPVITNSGRSGLGNASALDREVWDEFHADWEKLALECAILNERLRVERGSLLDTQAVDDHAFHEFSALRPATPEEIKTLTPWGSVTQLKEAFVAAKHKWDVRFSSHCAL